MGWERSYAWGRKRRRCLPRCASINVQHCIVSQTKVRDTRGFPHSRYWRECLPKPAPVEAVSRVKEEASSLARAIGLQGLFFVLGGWRQGICIPHPSTGGTHTLDIRRFDHNFKSDVSRCPSEKPPRCVCPSRARESSKAFFIGRRAGATYCESTRTPLPRGIVCSNIQYEVQTDPSPSEGVPQSHAS